MEYSSENENICDVFMNEIRVEDEMLPKLEKLGNFQTKGSKNPTTNEMFLKKLHAQRVFWRRNSKNALCWAFYCVNDNKEVNVTILQTMHCIFVTII
jgi:hypothetical protein